MKIYSNLRAARLVIGLAAISVVATPAVSQLREWQDYEVSDGVVSMTLVDLDPGTQDIYLEGLRDTWVGANEVAKRLGHIKDYAIYQNQYGAADEFDLVLVVEMENTTDIAPNRARYNQFMQEWGEQRLEQGNKTVLELYNKIREIKGEYLLREITLK
ncbi:MAG: hypothetical protein ACFBQW_02395 [Sphingomonadaceae bacterium]